MHYKNTKSFIWTIGTRERCIEWKEKMKKQIQNNDDVYFEFLLDDGETQIEIVYNKDE
jgi:hypothetical protein